MNQDPGQEPHPDELGTVRVRVQPGSAAIQVATDQLSRPKSMSPATIEMAARTFVEWSVQQPAEAVGRSHQAMCSQQMRFQNLFF